MFAFQKYVQNELKTETKQLASQGQGKGQNMIYVHRTSGYKALCVYVDIWKKVKGVER